MRKAQANRPSPPEEAAPRAPGAEDPTLARVGTFSDGVFAFAITLLILSIRMPRPSDPDAANGLLPLLLDQWRSIVAYLVSFMLIGMNWSNHRAMFSTFKRANHTLIWLNMLYLMVSVAFIPVPTAVLGAWLGDAKNDVIATVFYGLCVTVGASIYCILWWYAAYAAKLTNLDAEARRAHTAAYAPAPLVCAILTGLAFVHPWIAVGGFTVVIVLYILPVPRLIALKRERIRRSEGPS